MSFLDELNTELEKQMTYFIEKEDKKSRKRCQDMLMRMDKLAKTIENQFESGALTPNKFLSQINTFIQLDENTLKIFKSIKYKKGVHFIENRIKTLKLDKENLESVLNEDF